MPAPPILFVVHPDSACGSADFHFKRDAPGVRGELISELRNHVGGCVVLPGSAEAELSRYPIFSKAIAGCLRRARDDGRHSLTRRAHDPDQVRVAVEVARELGLAPDAAIVVTGAWTTNARDHCVDSVVDALRDAGFTKVLRSDSAANLDDVPEAQEQPGPMSPGY